jgi:F-type H+-transporting ATPase subunit b
MLRAARLRNLLLAAALVLAPLAASAPRLYAQQSAAPVASAPAAATPAAEPAKSEPAKQESSEEDQVTAMRHSAVVQALARMMHMDVEHAARLFEILNFLVLAAAIVWALTSKLPQAFKSRTGIIQKNLLEARIATESAQARLAKVEEKLGHLDTEIAKIHSTAEQDSHADEQRIRAAAEEDRQKVVAQAEQEIAAAAAEAQRQVRQFAAGLLIEQAATRLQVSGDADQKLIEDFAAKLAAEAANGRKN